VILLMSREKFESDL